MMMSIIRFIFSKKRYQPHLINLDHLLSSIKDGDAIIGYRCQLADKQWVSEQDADVVLQAIEEFPRYHHEVNNDKMEPIHFEGIIEELKQGKAFALGVLAYSRFHQLGETNKLGKLPANRPANHLSPKKPLILLQAKVSNATRGKHEQEQ